MAEHELLLTKLQTRIDAAWMAREAARAVGDKPLMRLHAAHANEMAETRDAICDESVQWFRKLPMDV